jgi:hypothetical protein
MQNTKPSEVIAAVHFSTKPPEGDEVDYTKTNSLRTNEAKEEAQVDESDTESNQLLKDPTTRQNSMGIRMPESRTDATVEFRYTSDRIRPKTWITNTALEVAQSSGKFLPNLTSIHPDQTLNFIGLLTPKC